MKEQQDIKGLSTKEAEKLQRQFGRNDVKEKELSWLASIAKKFYGPIPLMIEIALVLSAIVGKWEDFAIIFALLAVNVSVDFWQEHKARTALNAIKSMLSPTATALRDGEFATIDARELVPGDIVKISLGDIVPADAELVEDVTLSVDQSSITGESVAVEITLDGKLHASSIVQKGTGLLRITAIGASSAIGKSLQLVARAEVEEESHFQKAILGISRFLIILSAILAIVVFTALILRGDTLIETMRFVLVLAIASIPVALPAVLSVTMAVGASNLSKRNTIVSNFRAIEELAGVDRLCVDKTGTLTKNKMSVLHPKTYGNFTEAKLLVYALLASDDGYKTPVEQAIRAYSKEHGYFGNLKEYAVTEFTAFDPRTKVTATEFAEDGENVRVTMGATQKIAERLMNDAEKKQLESDVDALSVDGFKAMAVVREVGNTVELVGLLPFMDPPRDDAAEVIEEIHRQGVVIKMITGDNTAIARYVAKLLNIGTRIIEGAHLQKIFATKGAMDDTVLVANTDVFTEVTPEDKYNIIDTLERHGHIVAMTGDGVNDAPALKKAHVGIAVSGASAAARGAADIVLLDSGLSVIKHAIEQARVTFARMQSYATFRIAETIRIIFFISLAILLFNYSPITAVMIIVLALLNDIPIMAIAYDNAPQSDVPVRWHLRETIIVSSVLGITGLLSSFGLLYLLHSAGVAIAIIQTAIFVKLDVSGHSTLYITRTGRKHFWERPFPSLKFFLPAFSTRIIGTIMALFGIFMQPIGIKAVAFIWIYSTLWFLLNDQVKVLTYKILDKFAKKENYLSIDANIESQPQVA